MEKNSSKSPNTVFIEYDLDTETEAFIEEHAKNLEKYHRIGLSQRVAQILDKWGTTKLDFGKPLKIEKFSRVVQGSVNVRRAVEEFNIVQNDKRLEGKNDPGPIQDQEKDVA